MTNHETDRWERLQAIFAEATELSGEQRTALLDRECGEDAALRARAVELINAHDRQEGVLEEEAIAAAGALIEDPVAGEGELIGGYRVIRHHMEFQWKHYGMHALKPTDLRDRYVDEAWYDDAATFSDVYDQTSFDPAYDTMPLEDFEDLVREFFGAEPERKNRTAEDCL